MGGSVQDLVCVLAPSVVRDRFRGRGSPRAPETIGYGRVPAGGDYFEMALVCSSTTLAGSG